MKKKVLALLLGGVMAVGTLSVQMPVMAEEAAVTLEECDWHTEPHIESYEVTTVDGQLALIIDVKEFEGDVTLEQAGFTLVALEKQLENPTTWLKISDELVPLGYPDELCLWAKTTSGTYIFPDVPAGKTYYVYCVVFDHDWGPESMSTHDVMCLGSATPTVGPANTPSENTPSGSDSSNNAPSGSASSDPAKTAESAIIGQIKTAEAGSTVTMEGTTTLSNSVMKELLKKGDVSLKLEFTYNEEDYVIVIPAGAALDNDIPWYGPLYLAQQYGNSAGIAAPAAAEAGGVYEVKRGDTLSKIAAASNMTLKQLLAKNPQIKDANKISVGQKINR